MTQHFPSCACVLILVVAAGTPVSAGEKPALPPDLAVAARFNPFVAVAELGRVFRGREAATIKKVSGLHPLVITSQKDALAAEFGLPAEGIERVIIGPDAFVLTARKPIDEAAVLARLVPKATEQKAGGKTYHATDTRAVCRMDDRTVLVGPPVLVKNVLDHPVPANAPLIGAVRAAARWPLLLVAVNPGAFRAKATEAGPAVEPFLPLLAAREWRATLETGDDLTLRLRAEFADAAAARKGSAALGRALASLDKGYLAALAAEMPAGLQAQQGPYPGVKELAGRLEKVVTAARAGLRKAAAPRVTGTVVESVVHIETDEPVTTAVLLLSLSPRVKKK
jgi:hypothetical protein